MAVEISEGQFERWADAELRSMLGALDGVAEDLEADLESGILTLEFADGTKYVINSHRAARQIWMAAERNAWHFDPAVDDRGGETPTGWTATKSGEDLWELVEGVVGRKLGRPLRLARP